MSREESVDVDRVECDEARSQRGVMTPRKACVQVLAETPGWREAWRAEPEASVIEWVTGAAWAVLQADGVKVTRTVVAKTRIAAREAVQAARVSP